MNKKMMEYTQEERIELLKENLNQAIAQANLSLPILYYILQGYMKNFEDMYHQYQGQIFQSLNEKIQYNEKINLHNNIEQELKEESPDLKISEVEKE